MVLLLLSLLSLLLTLLLTLASAQHDNELWRLPIHDVLHGLGSLNQHDQITLDLEALNNGRHLLSDGRLTKDSLLKSFVRSNRTSSKDDFLGYANNGDMLHLVRRVAYTAQDHKEIVSIAGTIHSRADGLTYVVYPDADNRLHLVAKDTNGYLQEGDMDDDDNVMVENSDLYNTNHDSRKLQDEDPNSADIIQVDGMVLWTKQAECGLSSLPIETCVLTPETENAMRALIDQSAAQLDMAMQTSDARMRFTLVHAYRVDYVEDNDAIAAIRRMSSKIDGVMDDLHFYRDDYKADFVSMILAGATTCGNSYLGYPTTHSGLMFSAVPYTCATERFSFAHEFGHCGGCDHDRGYLGTCDSTNTNFGYKSRTSPIRDIMSTWCSTKQCDQHPISNCDRVMSFSRNADYVENGVNMGPIGDTMNDCSAQLRQTRFRIGDAGDNAGYLPPRDLVPSSVIPSLLADGAVPVAPATLPPVPATLPPTPVPVTLPPTPFPTLPPTPILTLPPTPIPTLPPTPLLTLPPTPIPTLPPTPLLTLPPTPIPTLATSTQGPTTTVVSTFGIINSDVLLNESDAPSDSPTTEGSLSPTYVSMFTLPTSDQQQPAQVQATEQSSTSSGVVMCSSSSTTVLTVVLSSVLAVANILL